jgi:hypothetical protein
MARRVNAGRVAAEGAAENEGEQSPESPLPPNEGGTPGVIPEATAQIVVPGQVSGSVHLPEPSGEPPPPPRRFQVLATTSVMLGGFRCPMREGKIIDDNAYDIEGLRNQGVRLKEFDPPAPKALAVKEE